MSPLLEHYRLARGVRAGQYAQQTPNLSRSRGYVSDSEHPLCTSPNARCPSSGSGWLDRPYPRRLLLCEYYWHTFLLSRGSEPGELAIRAPLLPSYSLSNIGNGTPGGAGWARVKSSFLFPRLRVTLEAAPERRVPGQQ